MLKQIDHRNRKILKVRVIIALHEVLGRRPTNNEIDTYTQALYSTYAHSLKHRAQSKVETSE